MADFMDFRLSPKMHIKINVFMGFLPKYTGILGPFCSCTEKIVCQ